MHHIPGFENRKKLIDSCMNVLAPKGLLAIAFWAFYEHERFQNRITAWDSDTVKKRYPDLDPDDLEAHDYLLDWRQGAHAYRYCHYVNQAELTRLVDGHRILTIYDEDSSNRYAVLEKEK
jgi:hypothetical protein